MNGEDLPRKEPGTFATERDAVVPSFGDPMGDDGLQVLAIQTTVDAIRQAMFSVVLRFTIVVLSHDSLTTSSTRLNHEWQLATAASRQVKQEAG